VNLDLLPNLCALLVFIGAFRPLARRAGPHTNAWFLAWIFVLLHNAALIFGGTGTAGYKSIQIIGMWALELGGICFLRAAVSAPNTRESLIISVEMALPIFAQSALVVFGAHRPILQAGCTLLMLVPGVHLLWIEKGRRRPRARMAWGFVLSAMCLAPFAYFDPAMSLSIVHCLLFLGSAALYWDYAENSSTSVFTAVIGLAIWGLVYPISMVLNRVGIASQLLVALGQFPSYIVAYGMILTIIEDYVRRTEILAMHDPLTGLPNRRLFEDRLEQVLAVAPNTGTMLACLVIDVDNFKTTNDTLGHGVGDGLLQAVATRLSWHIFAGDTLARTGGDEFAVVLTRLQSLEHLRFTVGAIMSATSAPVVVEDHEIKLGLSIGIAINPEGSRDADNLRHRADEAMYEAKRGGGNRFAYWGGPPDEVAHLLAGVPEHLRRAAQGQLHLR
jgi:diguanylate cyclase (GGDEF)-like protein